MVKEKAALSKKFKDYEDGAKNIFIYSLYLNFRGTGKSKKYTISANEDKVYEGIYDLYDIKSSRLAFKCIYQYYRDK